MSANEEDPQTDHKISGDEILTC